MVRTEKMAAAPNAPVLASDSGNGRRTGQAGNMSAVRSEEVAGLVDAFVQKVNLRRHERMQLEDVPPFLRQPSPDDAADRWTDWRILKADNSASIEGLETRLGRSFPSSFRSLIARYCFPAFECGPLRFFAHTGQNTRDDLSIRLFLDPHMSRVLLDGGYIQIGNPYFPNYDPICFAPQTSLREPPVVQLDHELILQFGTIKTVTQIAPSFIHLLTRLTRGDEMTDPVG